MPDETTSSIPDTLVATTIDALASTHGEGIRERAAEGVRQLADVWQESDGDGEAFQEFVTKRFAATPERRRELLERVEDSWYQLYGHLYQMRRMMMRWRDLDGYEDPGIDDLLYAFTPAPDFAE